MAVFRSLLSWLKAFKDVVVQVNRGKATGMLEFELKELENVFMLLTMGGFVGLPAPPTPVALEIVPFLENELVVLLSRSDMASDPIGSLMGMLEVD
ncbi:MAG TPA: hypothetical protein PK625_07915 [Spirochaetales bacterium]|nr:hypothetical protein [Spirochaetales bacterium]HPE37060.1 hypothetical protein [Spirochaetales bacterium]